jgi:hypothetical protein
MVIQGHNLAANCKNTQRHPDAIQPSKDPLEVPIGLVTRLKAKKFKEPFNGLLQETWAKVDFKRIVIIKSKP